MLRSILVSFMVLFCATVALLSQTDRAAAAGTPCTGVALPHDNLTANLLYVIDTDTGSCTNSSIAVANGFRILTDDDDIEVSRLYTANLIYTPAASAADITSAGVTTMTINTTATNVNNTRSHGVFTYNIEFDATDVGIQTYTINLTKNGVAYTVTIVGKFIDASTQLINSITVTGGVFGSAGPTESELIAQQQSFFTQLVMNHQSYNVISGVSGNLDGLFNGNGLAPYVSDTGFSFQSAGASKWYAERLRKAKAKKQPAALDILASQSRASQNKDQDVAARLNTANLMAYQSSNNNASTKSTKETIEKLDAVAKDDIYAADVTPLDEDNVFQSPWNVWVKGSWSVYEAHDSAAFDGHMVDVVGGVDYRLSDDLIIGVLGGYGVADFDTLTAGTVGSFDAEGYHAGVYLGKRLAPNLLLDALVAYTGSDYDNRSGTTTGSFSAHRVTVAAHLKGNIDWGMVTLQPTIGLMYASEKQDAYTDSAAVVHASKTVTAGRLSIGPKFIFQPMTTEFGMTQFWFATKGEYDFSNQNTSGNSSLPDISDVASARVQAGLSVANDSGVSLSLQGDVSGLGSGEFIGYGATAKVSVPF